jgi:metallo-beta-lactamase class B
MAGGKSMKAVRRSSVAAALTLALAASAGAQPLSEQAAASQKGGPPRDQGSTIKPAAQTHFAAADKAAGKDFGGALLLCNSARPDATKRVMPSNKQIQEMGGQPGKPPEATKAFDNLIYLGLREVTAWAVVTPKGIILIDSLNNKGDIQNAVERGLRKFGLDPAQIKYVVVTHGHGDHFGGAAYLAQKYHARVLMSDADWKTAPTMLDKPTFDAPPPRDMTVKDGQKLTLGGETLTLHITPGHTLGTVSLLIPVKDHGQPHVAALWGGTGFNFPHSPERFQTYADSARRFERLAAAAGADVPLSNHPENDIAIQKNDRLKARAAGAPNPYVMGQDAVRRYFTVYSECAEAYKAQISG